MKKWIRFLTVVLALCLLSSCAVAEGSKGILYRVSGGKNDMYLLGSIHIGSEAMYPFGDVIIQALESADTVVFECDTESADAIQAMMSMMSYPVGETLQEHLSPETYQALEQVAQKTGYPMSMFQAFKPWAAVSILSMDSTAAELGNADVTEAMARGVETQITALADGKQVAYLETTREQLEMMEGFSPELQDYMLLGTCNAILHPEEVDGMDGSIGEWPAWWYAGDAEKFAQSYLEGNAADPRPDLTEEYHFEICTQRNIRMAQRLAAMLESEEKHSYFVTVGLLHLVLPGDSVGSELQKLGYTVERII